MNNNIKNYSYNYYNIILKYYKEMKLYFSNLKEIEKNQININNKFLNFIKSYKNKNYKYNDFHMFIKKMFVDNSDTFDTFNIILNNTTDKCILNNYKYILTKFNELINKYCYSKSLNEKTINYIKLSIIFTFIYKIFNVNIENDKIYQILNHYFI